MFGVRYIRQNTLEVRIAYVVTPNMKNFNICVKSRVI